MSVSLSFFFFNTTATTEIYTLSLHDALPISGGTGFFGQWLLALLARANAMRLSAVNVTVLTRKDRKSTRLNSSHRTISYAVFCLKKKKKKKKQRKPALVKIAHIRYIERTCQT